MKIRNKKVDEEREKYVFQIIEYAQAYLNPEFDLKDLKRLSRKVARETSKFPSSEEGAKRTFSISPPPSIFRIRLKGN